MTKFLLLYTSDTSAAQQMQQSDEAIAASMQEWNAWAQRTGSALVDFGLPTINARTVTTGGAQPSSSNVGGYSIVEAADSDAAVALLTDHPHLTMGGQIEVLETMPAPGM